MIRSPVLQLTVLCSWISEEDLPQRWQSPQGISVAVTDICGVLTVLEEFRYATLRTLRNNKTDFLLFQVFRNKGQESKWAETDVSTKYFMMLIRVINNGIFTVLWFGTEKGTDILPNPKALALCGSIVTSYRSNVTGLFSNICSTHICSVDLY